MERIRTLSRGRGGSGEFSSEPIKILRALIETEDKFVITNQSLRVLLEVLSKRLDDSLERGAEQRLLEHWWHELPRFRDHLLALASEDRIPLPGGEPVYLMTEEKAFRLLEICPDEPDF